MEGKRGGKNKIVFLNYILRMDAEGGSNAIRLLALKALARRGQCCFQELHMAAEWAAPSSVPDSGPAQPFPSACTASEPWGPSQKPSSTAGQGHNCNRDELSLSLSDLIVLLSNISFFSV